jgi:AcrR family transcriptional regulator
MRAARGRPKKIIAMDMTSDVSPWKKKKKDRVKERQVKREAVLRVAARLFKEKGFYATSLDEVAERLHVTKPTVYR